MNALQDASEAASHTKHKVEPKLRHEFVGMMFAVTIGEVGLQAAALVQAGRLIHFLPAYTHLLLATVMVATSWVGWSLSLAPGARRDVEKIFQWEFAVLLLDVWLVVTYFILVRSINFEKEASSPRIDSASRVAFWLVIIFGSYLVWDVVTKGFIYSKYPKEQPEESWPRSYGSRMLPTVGCLILAGVIMYLVRGSDKSHLVTADLAMIFLVLLFRASKELVSALIPRKPSAAEKLGRRIKWPAIWTGVCALGMTLGILWTVYSWPLPESVVTAIESKANSPESSVPLP